MSKRRSSERGAGETSVRASKLQCPGISGNNAKRAGPFILGTELTGVCSSFKSVWLQLHVCIWSCMLEMRKVMCMNATVKVAGCRYVRVPETRM